MYRSVSMKIFNCALQRKGTFNLVPSKYKCCCNQSTGSSENGNKRRIKELLVEKSSLGKSAEKKASFVAGGQTEISQSQSGRKRKISGPSSYPGIQLCKHNINFDNSVFSCFCLVVHERRVGCFFKLQTGVTYSYTEEDLPFNFKQ